MAQQVFCKFIAILSLLYFLRCKLEVSKQQYVSYQTRNNSPLLSINHSQINLYNLRYL